MTRLVFLFLILLFSNLIFGQNKKSENIEWRQQGDLQFSTHLGLTTNSITNDFNSTTGNAFLIAGRIEYFFGKNWSLRSGIGYEKRDFGFGGLDFLAFPLYPAWHFGENRRWHLGIGAAYALGLDYVDNINTVLNIGVIIPIKDLRFYIELEGLTGTDSISFTDIDGSPIGSGTVIENRSSINVGFHF